MRVHRALAVAGVAAVTPLFLATPASADTVNFSLDEFNNSGAQATATITTNDDGSMTVEIEGTGFTPEMPHAQHIHGAPTGDFFCPPASADADGDGQVATEEGINQYGDVMVSLTTEGDTSADSGLAVDRMPVADADGNLQYSRTIPAGDLPEGLVENVENLHIVQHGMDVNGNDQYDLDALGVSVFAESLGINDIPQEATDPATCGEVTPAGGVETGGATEDDGVANTTLLAAGAGALLLAGGLQVAQRRRPVKAEQR